MGTTLIAERGLLIAAASLVLLLPSTGFRVCGLSSCGLVALWHGDPGSGIEPVSPALTGGFLTTGPPGKSLLSLSEIHIEIAII